MSLARTVRAVSRSTACDRRRSSSSANSVLMSSDCVAAFRARMSLRKRISEIRTVIARVAAMDASPCPTSSRTCHTANTAPAARATPHDPGDPLAQTSKHRHTDADGFVFVNAKNGGPIRQDEWPKDHWRAALRATGSRPRKFYATRHTFIILAPSRGVNLKWLAEYCGTSVAMIERSYGQFLAAGADHQLALLAGGAVAAARGAAEAG